MTSRTLPTSSYAINVIYPESAASVKLSDEEEEVLRLYLTATPRGAVHGRETAQVEDHRG